MKGIGGKARVSLKAAGSMFDQGYLDPAASRFYFAAFQAAVHSLETRARVKPTDLDARARGWQHNIVCGNAYLIRKQETDGILLEALRSMRRRADYEAASVERSALERRRKDVERFVGDLTA